MMHSSVNGKHYCIPDAWWEAASMIGFTPSTNAFGVDPQTSDIVFVAMSDILPPERDSGIKQFDEQRMSSILNAIRGGVFLPPVEVYEKLSPPYRYKVYDGYHRYYASAAVGFVDLPVIVKVNNFETFFSC